MWNATCFRSEQPDRVQGVVQRNNTDCHKKVLIVQICLINRVSKIHYESEENPFANMIFVSVFLKILAMIEHGRVSKCAIFFGSKSRILNTS